jgi:DNA modification methylase
MEIQTISVRKLKSNNGQIEGLSSNPRILKDDKFRKLVKSLEDDPEMLELRELIAYDNEGELVVICGNQRLAALKHLKIKEAKVKVLPSDTPLKKLQAYTIKDNVPFGEHDWDILANEWDQNQLDDWGLEFPHWEEEVTELEAEEDEFDVPEGGIETDIVQGDLFEIGEHRLLCGDSTDSDQINRLIGDIKKLSIYTDPPYGINEKGDRSERGGLTQGNKLKDFKDDSIQYAVDAYNITRQFDVISEVWWGANYYCHYLPQTNNWLVWDKRVEEKQSDTQSDCELAWVQDGHSSVRIFRHLWKGMMKDSERGQRRVHPTQKPVELANHCFKSYKMGDVILDLFGGSGATMVACEQTKKSCLMMEFEPHYCQVIIDRMLKLDPSLTIKRNGKKWTPKTAD